MSSPGRPVPAAGVTVQVFQGTHTFEVTVDGVTSQVEVDTTRAGTLRIRRDARKQVVLETAP